LGLYVTESFAACSCLFSFSERETESRLLCGVGISTMHRGLGRGASKKAKALFPSLKDTRRDRMSAAAPPPAESAWQLPLPSHSKKVKTTSAGESDDNVYGRYSLSANPSSDVQALNTFTSQLGAFVSTFDGSRYHEWYHEWWYCSPL